MAARAILTEWWAGSQTGRRRGVVAGRSGGSVVWRDKGAPSREKKTFHPRRVAPGGLATETAKLATERFSLGSSGSAGRIPRKLARTPEGGGGADEGIGVVARIAGVKETVEGAELPAATWSRGA